MIQDKSQIRGLVALKIFLLFAFAYFLSYAFRSINAVIAPELVNDLAISNTQLGLLSSAYFIGFACMQIPLGLAMDRYGSRRTESILLIFALLGAITFAFAEDLYGLMLGRLFIGVGVSACLMAAFTAYRRWFKLEQQGQLASGMLVFGTLGALLTTVPVQISLPVIGWRGVFVVMAVLVFIAMLGIRFGLPRFDDHPKHNQGEHAEASMSLWQIVRHPFFIRMLPLGVINHGGFMALQTLWIGPWFIYVSGFDPKQSAQILFLFNAAMLCAYAFNAWLIPKINLKGVHTILYVKWALMLSLVLQFFAITSTSTHAWIFWVAMAAASTTHILGQSTVSTAFPKQNAGVASTSYNLIIFIGAFFVQWLIGVGLDIATNLEQSKADAFRQVFFVFFVMQLAAYLWFYFYPKPLKKNFQIHESL